MEKSAQLPKEKTEWVRCQAKYNTMYTKSNELIDTWAKKHDDATEKKLDNYCSAYEIMHKNGEITDKQWAAVNRGIINRWNKLRNGYNKWLEKNNKGKVDNPEMSNSAQNIARAVKMEYRKKLNDD